MEPRALLPVEWVFHVGAVVAAATLLWALATPVPERPAALVLDDRGPRG